MLANTKGIVRMTEYEEKALKEAKTQTWLLMGCFVFLALTFCAVLVS